MRLGWGPVQGQKGQRTQQEEQDGASALRQRPAVLVAKQKDQGDAGKAGEVAQALAAEVENEARSV